MSAEQAGIISGHGGAVDGDSIVSPFAERTAAEQALEKLKLKIISVASTSNDADAFQTPRPLLSSRLEPASAPPKLGAGQVACRHAQRLSDDNTSHNLADTGRSRPSPCVPSLGPSTADTPSRPATSVHKARLQPQVLKSGRSVRHQDRPTSAACCSSENTAGNESTSPRLRMKARLQQYERVMPSGTKSEKLIPHPGTDIVAVISCSQAAGRDMCPPGVLRYRVDQGVRKCQGSLCRCHESHSILHACTI